MTENYRQFVIEGRYTNRGISGSFNGVLRWYGDGKIVGLTNDRGQDILFNGGEKKLIVGLGNQDGWMNFWKVCSSSQLLPLVYTLECIGGNNYEGLWAPIDVMVSELITGMEGNEGLSQLGEAFQLTEDATILDKLGEIPAGNIEAYMDPNLSKGIRTFSEDLGCLKLI